MRTIWQVLAIVQDILLSIVTDLHLDLDLDRGGLDFGCRDSGSLHLAWRAKSQQTQSSFRELLIFRFL